jgi:predicted metallopeptidase
MATEWSEAPKHVIELAQRIIAKHHPQLHDARIAFVMRSEAPRSNGSVTLGKARKVSAEQQIHMPYDFVIWLALDMWNRMTPKQKEALIDHELSHCVWDGFVGSIRGHDVEEFTHIIERYGFWWPRSDDFEMAVQAALLQPSENAGTVEAVSLSMWTAEGE